MNSRADQDRWREQLSRLLASPIDRSIRIAVLAAHPDDETIGASALLAHSNNPFVIYLTNGAPRDKKLWPPDFTGTREEYAALRRMEAMAALSYVGIGDEQVCWLGVVDQESIFQAAELANRLSELLARRRPDVLLTHPYEGGHPDHDAVALVARLAVSQFHGENAPALVEMTSYHARRCQCVTGEFLNGSPEEEMCLQLTAIDRDHKRKMFDAYASQSLVLGAFETTQERWRKAPEYDFSRPPHEGKLWYECMGWPMTGEEWCAMATESIARIQEPSCR
jgi:N-acetylglucosamine malate deacetylase 2